jgi:hypothetical protein
VALTSEEKRRIVALDGPIIALLIITEEFISLSRRSFDGILKQATTSYL